MGTERVVVTSCGMCYGTCTIRVHVKNNVVVKIEGEPNSPQGYGNICAKGLASILELYDPNRIRTPLLRTNPEKGLDVDPKWKPISWDEAIDIMVKVLKEALEYDPRSIYFAASATYPDERAWVVQCFQRALGTPNYYCSGGGLHCGNGAHMVGGIYHASWSVIPDFKYCNYAIYWGCSKGHGAGHAALAAAKQAADARARGMKLVVFDPFLSTQATVADEWVPIRVGTDAAVALAMINLLINEYGLYDRWYLKYKTNAPYLIGPDGLYVRDKETNKPLVWDPVDNKAKPFDDPTVKDYALEGEYEVNGVKCRPAFVLFREHVKKYTPEYASRIADVPASTIRRIAREFGEEARIGSTIEIDGKVLPYRPVASIYFRGSQGHYNQAWDCISLVLLNHVVGAADVPGGTLAFGPPVCFGHPETGKPYYTVAADEDGLLVAESWPYHHLPYPPHPPADPPQRLDLQDLFYIPTYTPIMIWPNAEEIWQKFKIPYRPRVMISWCNNQIMSVGNPRQTLEFLKKFKFIISFNIFLTEFENAVADLVLPDSHFLERYACSTTFPSVGVSCHVTGLGEWVWAIRQPAVPPMPEARPAIDVVLEVVKRLGLKEKYIRAFEAMVRRFYGLKEISPENKALLTEGELTFEKMIDCVYREVFGPQRGLEWFKEHGYIKWPKKVEEVYWRAFTNARVPIYLEWIIRAGRKCKAVAEKYGVPDLVDWDAHCALPDWRPCASHKETNPEYDLYAFYWRSALHTYSRTMENPILTEISELDPYTYTIQMHVETARKKGIKDGDLVWVESPKGRRIKGRVKLVEGIRPDHIAIAANAGHWAATLPIAKGKGAFFNELVEIDREHTCPVSLGMDICAKVKVYKA